jgi:DNA-binding XRE family transcriptional regulator
MTRRHVALQAFTVRAVSIRVRKPERSKGETKLARLRVTRGLSQTEMSELTGILPGTYWRLERGRLNNPRIRHLANCALVLGVSLEEIIEDEWLTWAPLSVHAPPPDGRSVVTLTR